MNCMKCGKKTEGEKVFCEDCLAEMEKYPVKPDVVIHIPAHPNNSESRKQTHRRQDLSPEEQLTLMRRQVKIMRNAMLILLATLLAVSGVLAYILLQPETETNIPTGRNYSTSTPAESD